MTPSIGSLFAGIGGLELGIAEATGGRVLFQVEIAAFPLRVLERRFPDARRFGDIREFAARLEADDGFRRENFVDILCGGFPCQDLSVAGRGAGLDGARSGLFFDYMRVIRALRPRVVIMENVTALLARGLGRVLGELAACGYDAEWDCIPASAVGAPHQRDRIWIVAYPCGDGGGQQPERQQQHKAERGDAHALHVGATGQTADTNRNNGGHEGRPDRSSTGDARLQNAADTECAGLERRTRSGDACSRWPSVIPASADREWREPPSPVRRMDDGFSARVDRPRRRRPVNDAHRLRALGNAVVPQVARIVGARAAELLSD